MQRNILIITVVLLFIAGFSIEGLAKEYDCTKPNPNGRGVIGFLFNPENTPQKQCGEILCTVYDNNLQKRRKICNGYGDYPTPNDTLMKNCIAKYQKSYDYNMKEFKSAKCYERHYAIVKYGPGECRIHFMVKEDGKAHYLDVTGDTKKMNDYHFKCTQLLENTYPKSHPRIKIIN